MKLFHVFFCFGIMSFLSCSTDANDCEPGQLELPNQPAIIDGAAYKKSVLECRLPKLQTFEFNSYSEAELIAAQGSVFIIGANSFTALDGSPVDGLINFSVLEMYSAGEIIACQLSTNGLNEDNNVEPLLSESIFYITATYNGNPVKMEGEIQVFIPSNNRDLELAIFNVPSCGDLECQILWEQLPQSLVYEEPYTGPTGRILGYRSFIFELGWFSFARYNESQELRGIIYNIALPPYSISNSNVFLKYDSNSIAIGRFSEYDEENAVFSEKYSQIPNNTAGNVIFVSKPESKFNFEAKQVITKDGKITVTRQLQSGSETELIDYINTL